MIENESHERRKLDMIKNGIRNDLLTGRVPVPESVFAAEAKA
jgi:hypothetical protein